MIVTVIQVASIVLCAFLLGCEIGWDRAKTRVAQRCLEILEANTFLGKLPDGDPGGCSGTKTGWCQSSVDAVCESRKRVSDAIREEFGIARGK